MHYIVRCNNLHHIIQIALEAARCFDIACVISDGQFLNIIGDRVVEINGVSVDGLTKHQVNIKFDSFFHVIF